MAFINMDINYKWISYKKHSLTITETGLSMTIHNPEMTICVRIRKWSENIVRGLLGVDKKHFGGAM